MGERDYIEVSNSKMLNPDYIEREIQKASALLRFRKPGCKIVVEELENKIVVKAEMNKNEEEEKRPNQVPKTPANENILKLNNDEEKDNER